MAELLTTVKLVCASHLRVAALPHVTHSIDAFLWAGTSSWTLESATKRGIASLLDRLLQHEWPFFKRQCRELRLCRAISDAVVRGYDIQVVVWWIRRYMPDQIVYPVAALYKLAISYAHLPVLEWIYQETKGNLPRINHPYTNSSPDAVAWLIEHGDCHSFTWFLLNKLETLQTSFKSIKRCLEYQDENRAFEIYYTENVVTEALHGGQLGDLQWLYQHRPQFFDPRILAPTANLDVVNILSSAVRYGNLEAAKWLMNTFPQHYLVDPRQTFEEYVDGLRPYRYNLNMVKWVLCEFVWRKPRNRNYWMCDASDYAASTGNMKMLEFVYQVRMQSFPNAQTASKAMRRWGEARSPVMDDAAAIGHLGILKYETVDLMVAKAHAEGVILVERVFDDSW